MRNFLWVSVNMGRRRLQSAVLLCVMLSTFTCARSGVIRNTLVYNASGSPYEIMEDVFVDRQGQMIVEPGVEMRFAPGVGILVKGILKVQGTSDKQITLTALRAPEEEERKPSPYQDLAVHRESSVQWPSLRLVDGPTILKGRLQLLYRERWWAVCSSSKNWTEYDAKVACRQLGFSDGVLWGWIRRHNDSRHFMYSSPGCSGLESALDQCSGWDQKQLGNGVCDYHLDVEISCMPTLQSQADHHWRGIEFDGANAVEIKEQRGLTKRLGSLSLLEHVVISYGGRQKDGTATAALQISGVPPVMQSVEVRWSAYHGINVTKHDHPFEIKESSFYENRGYGIFINSTTGQVNLSSVVSRDNGADGVVYAYHESVTPSRLSLCETPDSPNVAFPMDFFYILDEKNAKTTCTRTIESSDPSLTVTVHFKNMLRDEGPSPLAGGTVTVFDGDIRQPQRQLAHFVITNTTRPQSVSSRSHSLIVQFQPPQIPYHLIGSPDYYPVKLLFTMQAVLATSKAYDINMTGCQVDGNNGRGIWVRDMITGVNIYDSSVSKNSHVAGIHVDGGVGDVTINATNVRDNFGDGINVTYAGGYRHIHKTIIEGNAHRGVAFWLNETSDRIPFNFTTHVSQSVIQMNKGVGVLLGNVCMADAFWNISMNSFRYSGGVGIEFLSCWKKTKGSFDTLLILNNIFNTSAKLSVRIMPALNVKALIANNAFLKHRSGVLRIENIHHGEFLEDYEGTFADVDIAENYFTENKGIFVAKLGLVQDSKVQNLSFHHNRLVKNIIRQPFSHLKPRSRVAAIVVVTSNNTVVRRNEFSNPDSSYELGSHLEDNSKVIDASLNYWSTGTYMDPEAALHIYNRIFDRKDRYNLAPVEFLQYLTRGSDLDTDTQLSNSLERDKTMNFRKAGSYEIGGEVMGTVTLETGEYLVKKDIFVRPGSQLVVKPGSKLRFEQSIGMMVQGRLDSDGSSAEITYTLAESADTEAAQVIEPGSLRLSGGHEGVVQVTTNGTTGGVCAYGFTEEDAALVCQELGMVLSPRDWLLEASSHAAGASNRVILSNVQCDDMDTNFLQCKHEVVDQDFENSCNIEVGIRCARTSWSGIRLGVLADSSIIRKTIIEKAGLLDFATHTFKAALQLDFNNHILEDLTIANNVDSGIGLMWNDIFKDVRNPVLRFSRITGNGNHGIITRSQGVDIEENTIFNNDVGGIYYDPLFTKREQREMIQWIGSKATAISETKVVRLSEGERRYIRVATDRPDEKLEFQVTCTDRMTIGVMVVDPFKEASTESLIIRRGKLLDDASAPLWDVHQNLTAFPLRETGFIISLRYKSGPSPKGGVLLMVTAVQPLAQAQWLQYKPSIRIERNVISRCQKGIASNHYNRDVSEHNRAFYYHRYSNETVLILNNTITETRQEAVFVASPLWDPLTSAVAEITYNLTGNTIENNGGGIKHFSRDLRISNNLFHWIINGTHFASNKGGVDLRLPYVWQYDENYTHSVVLCNNSFFGNTFFVLHVDGHFARFNATGNEVRNNESPPGRGLFTIGGMEKEMLIVHNMFTDNHAKYVVEFDLESHSERFSIVDANFYRNSLKNNFAAEKRGRSRSPEVNQYEPSSYALSVRGVQSINITENYLTNPDMQFEFLAGVRTSSLRNSINVGHNWWGSIRAHIIRSRIFDFDDWNGYATAEFSPYLAREEYDGATLSDDGNDITSIDLSQPLGGPVSKSMTLYPRSTPYIVKSDLTVLPGATMTILAGVEMEFYPSVGILVLGDLVAMGRPSDPIKMGPLKRTTPERRTRSVPSVRNVRLCIDSLCRGGPRRDGFLEMYNASTLQWVPICDQRFTERNAEVVCRELGYGTLDVLLDRGPRYDYGATELSRIQSWPQPLECVGQEKTMSSCELRLNGYGEHNYACSYMGEHFIYIHCGSKSSDESKDYWGGIRFSVPSYQARHRNDASHNSRRYIPPKSSIRHVDIRGAGVLHNEKSAAVQVVLRHVTLEHINISDCASHGIQVLASPGYQYIHAINVTRNLGTGVSFLTLNGQTSAEDRLNYVPLGAVDLPYDVFGFVDICDNNKEFLVDGRILLYYKYDNRPVDCVKIFTSNSYVEKVGFRILQFNLFNATEFTPQPDTISIYDGDIFNYTVSKIGDIRVGHKDKNNISQKRFYRSQGITLSIKLHASGASSSNGFIAEVVTLPLRAVTARDSKHNITASYFAENRQGALAYRSAGEITPILTLHSNRFENNGSPLFGNFTSSEGAAVFDIQNSMEMHVLRNLFLRNQGGLRLHVNSANSVSALQGEIKNNLFTQNKNRESLCVIGGPSGNLQRVHAFRNYFVREDAGEFRDNILLERIQFNFSENLVAECKGRHQITVTGFDGVQSSTQTVFRNWFWDNDAAITERKATVLARSPGQKYHWNYFYNRMNYFEMITANDSQRLEKSRLEVDAQNNWWGSGELPAVSGRVYDSHDQYELLSVGIQPFLYSNDTVLSGNCVGGWEMIEDTCFRYIPGAMTYQEAKHFCQLDNSSIPYVKQKHAKLIEYVTREQEDFDWEFEQLWVQSIDIPLGQCSVLYRGSVYHHDCSDRLPFLCERAQQIIIRTDYWYQEPVSIAALSLIAAVLLCVCVCLAFWCCKSRERHKEHLQRQNSIRASMRSASSRSLDHQSLFTELGYKRRIERAIKEASSHAPHLTSTTKHNGSADSVSKQYSYDPDDSQSYEIHEVRNPALDYSSEMEDKYATVPTKSEAKAPVKSPPFELTYENQGYVDRSTSGAGFEDSPDASRDWSSGTDSTLDIKRTLEMAQPEPMDPMDNTFRGSQTLPSSQNLYLNNGMFFKKPLETAM